SRGLGDVHTRQICYDLRFPAWSRCKKANYDLLIVPANWPRARAYAWEHLLIARAIENQCSVIGADRGGADQYGDYQGLTYIFDCRGVAVSVQPAGCPFIMADLSRHQQDEFRRKFPAGNDADEFNILY
ncbi:MAG: nitrilase family protein, partial [Muribaculaceae bacterium]|nr:nitrilase family protein [Muribaculaceae bacterium]